MYTLLILFLVTATHAFTLRPTPSSPSTFKPQRQGHRHRTLYASPPTEEAKPLPFWWDAVWKLPIMQPTPPGTKCAFGDSALVLKSNIEQIYGGEPSADGCPLASGELNDIEYLPAPSYTD